jgi:hypothetical protein
MEENEAVIEEEATATPIFSVYRRGYDPDQVDRYVGDQQRRLDEALHRASESERKLAAAVGQLRELHRRVAVYESEARAQQPAQLDTLGERVQRILQEAWEGAYNLRQEAEREVGELRDQAVREVEELRAQAEAEVQELRETASREAADVVDEATRRALHIRDETERRRQAYLERVERDRERAIAQITYLYDQRQGAIAELARLQATVEATITEMVRSPLGRPAPGIADASSASLDPDEPMPLPDELGDTLPGLAIDRGAEVDGFEDEDLGEVEELDDETLIAHSYSEYQATEGRHASPVEQEESPREREESYFAPVDHAEIPTGPMERIEPEPEYTRIHAARPAQRVFDGEEEGWA